MLCRALIAAVAVTCTLSYAHGQATQRLDRIKDLMCVLLLSGMQKEDLDVSMLTKLQSHNVNIDDMNNEELIQACIQSRNDSIKEKVRNVKNVTNVQPVTTILSSKSTFNVVDCKTNAALKMLKTPLKLENVTYNMSNNYKTLNEFHENNKNKASKENTDDNNSSVDEVIQYPNGQPKLERAFKLLQEMIVNKEVNHTPISQSASIKEQENKRSITDNLHSFEADALYKLIANFMSKKKTISTKPTTTEKSLNIEDLYEKLFSLRNQDKIRKKSNVYSEIPTNVPYLPIERNSWKAPVKKVFVENESDTETEEPINVTNHVNLTDTMTLLNTYKSFNPFISEANVRNQYGNAEENFKLSKNPYFNSFRRPKMTKGVNIMSTTNREPNHEISRSIIKEIADSVKEVILRDLRKELYGRTTLTTTITTTTLRPSTEIYRTAKTETTIKPPLTKENTTTQDSVMNKFLELFEEIKSLKRNIIIIPNKTEVIIDNKEARHNAHNTELKVFQQMTMSTRIPNKIYRNLPFNINQALGIKQYRTENSENIYNFAPQEHRYRTSGTFKKQEPKELNKGLLPITVQTNNIEIPPLGIPLDNPQNLIRQNIVITTTVPYRIVTITNTNDSPIKKGHQHRGIQNSEASKSLKTYKSKQNHPRLFKESHKPSVHQYHSNSKDDVIRFTLNNNEHSKYNTDYYEKINIGKYNPYPDSEDLKKHEIPRFHEKLEQVERYLDYPEVNKYTDKNDCCNEKYRYSEAMVNCCNRKIASRHQMSLNNMKNKSYDDTHFKNFLQSQQKVTDILEKILGDKTNIQSVETA